MYRRLASMLPEALSADRRNLLKMTAALAGASGLGVNAARAEQTYAATGKALQLA